jgi:hypothetical protein
MFRPDGQQFAPPHARCHREADDRADVGVSSGPSCRKQAGEFTGPQAPLPPLLGSFQAQSIQGIVPKGKPPLMPRHLEQMTNRNQRSLQGRGFDVSESFVAVGGKVACTKL